MICSVVSLVLIISLYSSFTFGCELNVLDVNGEVCTERSFNIPVITNYGNKTYYFEVNKLMNWHNAYLACKQYNMDLLIIDSDAEFDYIRDFIESVTTNQVHVWTSGTDLGTEGEQLWMSNGRKIISNRWHAGQPSNAGNVEHCIHFWYYTNIYLLNDAKCEDKMAFICQGIKNIYYITK